MATNDSLKQTLEHFKQQRQKKLDEMLASLRGMDEAIRQIQMQLGETPEDSDSLAGLGSPVLAETLRPSGKTGGVFTPRADEFFGMSQSDAAKAFLEKVGHAVTLDELVAGLKAGACKVGGADPKRTLYISLVRNVREFVPTGNNSIGLRKFYPNTAKPSSAGVKKKKKRPIKAKAAKRAKAGGGKAPEAKAKLDPNAVKDAVWNIMRDGTPRTPDELLTAIAPHVAGGSVKKITLYGTLRSKDFEQIGEKYRLKQPEETAHIVQ
jgi:hypothetical protein